MSVTEAVVVSNRTASFLIAVRHDAQKLADRIAEVWSYVDEVVVVHDGECEDDTVDVALECGATVITAPYEGYCEPQRKRGLTVCTSDWVLMGDVDEVFAPKFLENLQQTIDRAVRKRCDRVAIRRLEYYLEPQEVSLHVRLFKRESTVLSDIIHIQPGGPGRVLNLRGVQFTHYSSTDGPHGDRDAAREKSRRYANVQKRLQERYAARPEIISEFLRVEYNTGEDEYAED